MIVTPDGTSVFFNLFVDEPEGALKTTEIFDKAKRIVLYCQRFKVPLAKSLEDLSQLEKVILNAIEILVTNKKLDKIGIKALGTFFTL